MRLDGNISVTDARAGTRAPFTPDSTLDINGKICPVDVFCSVRVFCVGNTRPPLFFSSVAPLPGYGWRIFISDANASVVGYFRVPKIPGTMAGVWARPVLSPSGILRGHVAMSSASAPALIGALYGIKNDTALASNAFKLLPFCLLPRLQRKAAAFKIGESTTASDLCIVPWRGVHASVSDGTAALDISVPASAADGGVLLADGFKWLKLDNAVWNDGTPVDPNDPIWIGGCHVIVRSGLTSNLRVLNEGAILSLEGVLDG